MADKLGRDSLVVVLREVNAHIDGGRVVRLMAGTIGTTVGNTCWGFSYLVDIPDVGACWVSRDDLGQACILNILAAVSSHSRVYPSHSGQEEEKARRT